jgi:hypothetical protein
LKIPGRRSKAAWNSFNRYIHGRLLLGLAR